MNILALVKILLPLCVLLVLSHPSNGLKTGKCNEARLKVEIKNYGSCLKAVEDEYLKGGLMKVYNEKKSKDEYLKGGSVKVYNEKKSKDEYLKGGLMKVYNEKKSKKGIRKREGWIAPAITKDFYLPKACHYHNKLWKRVEKCNNELSKNCFDSEMAQLGNAVQSLFELRCQSPYIAGWIDPRKLKNFLRLAKTIIGKSFEQIKFDKSCSLKQMADEFERINLPCFKGIASTFYHPVAVYFSKGDARFPGYVSSCKTITSALDSCLSENACFSQNEMDLVREWASTFYQWEMYIFAEIADEISLSEVLVAQAKQPEFDDFNAKILETVDFVIKDFKNKDCKKN